MRTRALGPLLRSAAILLAAGTGCLASEPGQPAASVTLKALPRPLAWMNQPLAFQVLGADALAITAAKGTDLYPSDGKLNATAPMLLFPADGSFVLTVQARVDFGKEFDGGFLVAYADEQHWAKLLFEKSHYGPPSVCSAVTKGEVDDCVNGDIVGNTVWLRMTRNGDEMAFYDSLDGKRWTYVRLFKVPHQGPLRIGFASQAPVSGQCRTVFSHISYSPKPPADFWSGAPAQ
ncbi:MAG: DUF1349 domain-containing protein [Acidobacteria bacterium]|nr:DUF1349 domain-containing protein [Acidobacteriota bacterium]MBI3486718.1 DUF1349 domain-containing protein [Acidobacteriota bacterium]